MVTGEQRGGHPGPAVSVPLDTILAAVRRDVSDRRQHLLADLAALVRIPSVSADPASAPAVRRCAALLATLLRRIGLPDARLVETATHPLVVGSWRGAPGRSTLLVYGHYDVQPAGSRAAWRHAPFEATIAGDRMVGRGTADDKGQLLVHLAAIDALRRIKRRLPLNVVAVFDGAEETGSPSLERLLATAGPWRSADAAVISDTRMAGRGRPALTGSLRGLLSLDIVVERPGPAVHAGHLGGAVPDPLAALAWMIAGLHDRDGRVAVPGFYAAVRPVGHHRVGAAADAALLSEVRSVAGLGEPGWTLVERTTIRPDLTVTGLAGGGVGTHAQATVANRARATLDVRLVADQRPADVDKSIRAHLDRLRPPGIRVAVRTRSAVLPVTVDLANLVTRHAAAALGDGFGRRPVILRSGGSSPAVVALQAAGIPVALMGFALPDSRIHGANEELDLPTFFRGIVASASFMERLGRGGGSP
jgi:acetylornithine deacetylase/succinyl-diaminopimelate desuccinylase-like protein